MEKSPWKTSKVILNQENKQLIEEFLLMMKLSNRSLQTIYSYKLWLQTFFADELRAFDQLSSEDIYEKLIPYIDGKNVASSRRRLSILSSFYTFCIQEEHLSTSPIKKRWYPKIPQPLPKYLDKETISKTRFQSESMPLRDQTLVELFLATGCRVGELHLLNIEEVNLETRTARVIGKGRKIRYVHFTDRCALLLEKYLASRRDDSPALFVSRYLKRLSIRGMQHVIEKIGEEAGLDFRLHPHRFRHTFATELLAKGADLAFISEELGHSNLATTQIYARLPKREIVSMYRKFMG
ncbi:tyrosine-type recombinase/integrase [Bacillus sp. FJAT-45037]|uniref:tyrosine-type recombinase/integrase n=1 Tax=Bacillus sp. FJAT-45037 TaxID=2011007 RepID=UPI000C241B56|nr:tyrosine-type recombinase/integrase [Bacillus sp. FJAT-45037]